MVELARMTGAISREALLYPTFGSFRMGPDIFQAKAASAGAVYLADNDNGGGTTMSVSFPAARLADGLPDRTQEH